MPKIEIRKPLNFWTLENLIKDAKRFRTRKTWKNNSPSAYSIAQKSGQLEICCAHMDSVRKSWTDQEIIEEAKRFNIRSEWKKKSTASYKAAQRRGMINACCSHMKVLAHEWTDEALIKEAKLFTTRTEWAKAPQSGYYAAKDRGILDACCGHMVSWQHSWTEEELMQDAKRFSARVDWVRNSRAAYATAYKRGIVDAACAHMDVKRKGDYDAVYIWKAIRWAYNGKPVYKIGVTSSRLGEIRIYQGAKAAEADAEIVILKKVIKAKRLESVLLNLGDNPRYVDFGGCTEFRALDDDQLQFALDLISQHSFQQTN